MNNQQPPALAATKPAPQPTLSQFQSAPATGGRPGGKMQRISAEPLSNLKWKTVFSFGWKLIGICRGLVLLYAILTLTHETIDRGGAQLFGYLTNQISISSPIGVPTPPAGDVGPTATQQESAPARAERPSAEIKSPGRRVVGTYLGWVALAVCGLGFSIPLKWLTTKMDVQLSNRLRTNLFDRVLKQSPEFFHNYDSGQLNVIINQMTIETEMTLRQIIVDPLLQLIVLGGTTGLVSYNFIQLHKEPLAVFGAQLPSGAIPPIIVTLALFSPYLISKIGARIRRTSKAVQTYMLALSSLITGATQSPEEIQAMEAERIFSDKHNASLDKSLNATLQQTVTIETVNLVNRLPTLLVEIALLGFAVWLVLKPGGNARPGDVVAVLLLAPMLMSPIQALSAYLVMATKSWPNIETVFDILQSHRRTEEQAGAVDTQLVAPTIEARNVAFSYKPGSRQIFTGLSFTIPPEKTTGFVAKMGQGKTTFFKLALRFYDPQQGQILVGGRPTTDYAPDTLRQRIAMMSQFPAFFFDTVRENLRMAKPDATDEELQGICERTGVWKILSQKLPPSDTGSILDANLAAGKTLSGGERKLLALTRCLLRDPALLFLDEPTVGMDNEEKFEIRKMLREGTRGKTVMVVDHDVNWLLQFCDYFVVLDEGTVVEQGTAKELLSHDGLLYQLYMAAMGPKTKEIATYIARV
jgi:ABC-type multidrug transport system fused ATPase/permease subunit